MRNIHFLITSFGAGDVSAKMTELSASAGHTNTRGNTYPIS